MSYFDDASLVLIPSGYKDQKIFSVKPLDGAGDLAFSRASNATRVASNGLIEKVRTNLVLQSNSFDTTWTNTNSTETSGQAGYDGTNNAWLLTATTGGGFIAQSIIDSGIITISVYAKAGTLNWLRISEFDGANAWFDLANGVVGSTFSGTNAISRSIESVGGGWYRCSMTTVAGGNSFRLYPATANNSEASAGNIVIQAAQREQGDIATDYIATTTTAVSVGPVSGLPRLDYLNSTCPRLLLEPQRTNVVTFSEQFDNAGWTKTNVTLTSTLGGPIDQSKYFTITCNGTAGTFKGVGKTFFNTSPNTYSLSVFAKAGNSSTFVVSSRATLTTNDVRAIFNLSNGTITSTNGGTAAIVPYGDGWFRCSFTVVNAGTFTDQSSIFFGHPFGAADGATVLATGAMSEIGAHPSSYIPTLSTSVTRVADAASKTGISSLLGTKGTLFVEMSALQDGATSRRIALSDGTLNNRVTIEYDEIAGRIRTFIVGSGTSSANLDADGYTQTNKHKIAVVYDNATLKIFVDGALANSVAATMVPTGLSRIDTYTAAISANYLFGNINQLLVFPTALTDTQAIELTA
jgi:hypothetical protein